VPDFTTREATAYDRQAIFELAKPYAANYPRMRLDIARAQESLRDILYGRHFSRVAEVDGEVQAVLLAVVADNLWAARQNCNIVLWISHIPGAGRTLLREFTEWVHEGRFIKVAGACPDLNLDPTVYDILLRAGFEKRGGSYLLYN
jgi:hypothetical protein